MLLWRVFRRELEETGVSLTCSQATIHGPRTTTGVLSSPKLLGGLTGNTDATRSPKHPQSVNPHRAAAQPTHPGRAHGTIFIIHGAAQLPLQLLATLKPMPLSVEMVQAMDASAAGSGRGPHDLRRRRPLLLQVKIQSKLIAMPFVTSAVVSAVLGFIGYESRRTSRRASA